jgi:hypothetical protein
MDSDARPGVPPIAIFSKSILIGGESGTRTPDQRELARRLAKVYPLGFDSGSTSILVEPIFASANCRRAVLHTVDP